MIQMAETWVAYLAGVLDAAAIFRVRETAEGTQLPVVAVHGLSGAILELLAEATGTKVTWVNRDYSRAPCTDHCNEQHQHIQSRSGRWSVTGAKATVVIEAVLPYLRSQRAVAEEVLAVGKVAPRKPATYGKMAALGWPIRLSSDDLKLVQ